MIELACAVEKINNKKSAYHFNTYGPRAPLMSFARPLQRKKQKAMRLAEVKNDKK